MTGLTGFSKENNLVENVLDRLAIQNLLPNLGGISDDIALFSNNLRNESILTIRTTEFTQYVITLANINNDFKTRSNVFTNGDKVDAYYNDVKQNTNQLYIKDSNTISTFSLSEDINLSSTYDLTTLQSLGGDIVFKRSNATLLENISYASISDIDYARTNAGSRTSKTFEYQSAPGEKLSEVLDELELSQSKKAIKYRKDGSLSVNFSIRSEGPFTSQGDVYFGVDEPGFYITDATSPPDNPVAIRAFSNDYNPWTDDLAGGLVTQASTVTMRKLVVDGDVVINGINVATEVGVIADVFTHKLPITIDGQTYFLCLNKPD